MLSQFYFNYLELDVGDKVLLTTLETSREKLLTILLARDITTECLITCHRTDINNNIILLITLPTTVFLS